jgi:hypothetical protein
MLLGIPCLVENPWTSIGVIHKDSGHLLSPKKIYANKCKRPWDPHLAPVDGEICFANHPRNGWFMSFGLFGGKCRQRLPLMFQCKLWGYQPLWNSMFLQIRPTGKPLITFVATCSRSFTAQTIGTGAPEPAVTNLLHRWLWRFRIIES